MTPGVLKTPCLGLLWAIHSNTCINQLSLATKQTRFPRDEFIPPFQKLFAG